MVPKVLSVTHSISIARELVRNANYRAGGGAEHTSPAADSDLC